MDFVNGLLVWLLGFECGVVAFLDWFCLWVVLLLFLVVYMILRWV